MRRVGGAAEGSGGRDGGEEVERRMDGVLTDF